jgi:hypothetical protein
VDVTDEFRPLRDARIWALRGAGFVVLFIFTKLLLLGLPLGLLFALSGGASLAGRSPRRHHRLRRGGSRRRAERSCLWRVRTSASRSRQVRRLRGRCRHRDAVLLRHDSCGCVGQERPRAPSPPRPDRSHRPRLRSALHWPAHRALQLAEARTREIPARANLTAVGADGRAGEAGGRPCSFVPFGIARPPTCIL